MKKNIKHLIALLIFGFFIFTALSSFLSSGTTPSCPELSLNHKNLGYFLCEPISPELEVQNEFTLKVLDQETGKPLKNIRVKVYWTSVLLDNKIDCELSCYGRLSKKSESSGFKIYYTNEEGVINGKTALMKYQDKRDVQVLTFQVDDLESKYSEKFIEMRFGYNSNKIEKIVNILNMSGL